MKIVNSHTEFSYPDDKEDASALKSVGRKLFYSASRFYEVYAPRPAPKEEKAENLKYLTIIMKICVTRNVTETEEQKALQVFTELNDGLTDGTLKTKEISTILREIKKKLTDKNFKSKVISQLIELDYRQREYHISLEESKNFQQIIDQLIDNITLLPNTHLKTLSKEITIIDGLSLSRTFLTQKLHTVFKKFLLQ